MLTNIKHRGEVPSSFKSETQESMAVAISILKSTSFATNKQNEEVQNFRQQNF